MKILNSLKGEWTIDFTQAPFADNSLFAITGPTGAGSADRAHPRADPGGEGRRDWAFTAGGVAGRRSRWL